MSDSLSWLPNYRGRKIYGWVFPSRTDVSSDGPTPCGGCPARAPKGRSRLPRLECEPVEASQVVPGDVRADLRGNLIGEPVVHALPPFLQA